MTRPDYGRLSRRQAERAAGVSRATLARYLADGRLSAGKDAQGRNVYDAAELQRVFPDSFDLSRLESAAAGERLRQAEAGQDGAARDPVLAGLLVERRHLVEECRRLGEEVARLRHELAEERRGREAERQGLVALIRQGQETVRQLAERPPPAPRLGFWRRLLPGRETGGA